MTSIFDLKDSKNLTLKQKAGIVTSDDFLYIKNEFNIERCHFQQAVESESIYNSDNYLIKTILVNNRHYGFKTKKVKIYNKFFEELCEDKKRQFAEDRTTIEFNQCRCCKKTDFAKYDKQYFEICKDYEVLYSFDNGYCEECAKAKSEIKHVFYKTPYITKRSTHHLAGDKYQTETIYWSDGSVMQSNDGWLNRQKK